MIPFEPYESRVSKKLVHWAFHNFWFDPKAIFGVRLISQKLFKLLIVQRILPVKIKINQKLVSFVLPFFVLKDESIMQQELVR